MNADAATRERDTPNVVTTVAVALVCFAVGAVLVLPLRHREDPAATGSDQAAAPAMAPTNPSDDNAAQTDDATQQADDATQQADRATASAALPPPTEPTEPTPTEHVVETAEDSGEAALPTGLQLIPGRVAYLRCDGLRAEKGAAFPCPRDVTLEGEAWAVLGALPRCRPPLDRGGVDVRLDMVRGKPTEVRVLPIAGSPEPTLDAEGVYACVGKSLAKLNTNLDPIYMVVSLRASLR